MKGEYWFILKSSNLDNSHRILQELKTILHIAVGSQRRAAPHSRDRWRTMPSRPRRHLLLHLTNRKRSKKISTSSWYYVIALLFFSSQNLVSESAGMRRWRSTLLKAPNIFAFHGRPTPELWPNRSRLCWWCPMKGCLGVLGCLYYAPRCSILFLVFVYISLCPCMRFSVDTCLSHHV